MKKELTKFHFRRCCSGCPAISSSTQVPCYIHLGWDAWRVYTPRVEHANMYSSLPLASQAFRQKQNPRGPQTNLFCFIFKNGQVPLYQSYRRAYRHDSGCLYLDVHDLLYDLWMSGKDLSSSRIALPVCLELRFGVKVKMTQHSTYKT